MTAARRIDRRALGLALTRLANATAAAPPPLRPAPAHVARRIGITGAPGAGKSTLTGRLALLRVERGPTAVLAIDPSSPKTGGAILGDRIRMDELAGVENLYIRSLGSRSAIDGLTDNFPEMLDVMDDYGFDEVLVETVGAGQAEHAVRLLVDTVVLVLLPDSGDIVQAMKAGIMEMADIYVVNKADLPGAPRMAGEVSQVLRLATRSAGSWVPPVLLTSSQQPESIAALSEAVDRHQAWLEASGEAALAALTRRRYRLRRVLERRIEDAVRELDPAVLDLPLETQAARVLERLRAGR